MLQEDWLDPDKIKDNLPTRHLGHKVLVFESTASTNDIAAEYARNAENHGLVVFAEHQSCGRGRARHQWVSGPGHSLLCSVLLTRCPLRPELLSLTSAVATAEADTQLPEGFSEHEYLPELGDARAEPAAWQSKLTRIVARHGIDVAHVHEVQNVGIIEHLARTLPVFIHLHNYRFWCPGGDLFHVASAAARGHAADLVLARQYFFDDTTGWIAGRILSLETHPITHDGDRQGFAAALL